jgi:serine/threonine protein kinase
MATADPMQPLLAVGTEVAGYRVEAFISRGGMAVVYRGHDRRLGRRVALKLLAPELSQNERFQQRFLRESRLAASLDHPNIVPIYEAGEADGLLYIVMRYVEGSDLKALLDREGPLDPSRVVSILSQVGAALDAAHARGLVHRDVKPGNILIASGAGREDPDHVYLTDFGLTKRSSSLSGLTSSGHFIGTMDYVAPEQIGGKPVDARTDIYSLGCVLYQCLTGDPPFDRDDEAALLWAHLVERPPSISSRRPDVPPGVDAVVARAMAKAPEDRHRTCRELVAAFQAEIEGQAEIEPRVGPVGARRRSEPTGPPAPATRSAPLPAGQRDGKRDRSRSTTVTAEHPGSVFAVFGARRSRNRTALLAVAVVVLLAAVSTAVFMITRGDEALSGTFAKDNLVPFSFRHPADWQKEGSGTEVVFSPRAHEIFPLFGQHGAGESWAPTGALLQRSPSDVVGLYTFFLSTQYHADAATTEQLQEGLKPLLPAGVTFSPVHDKTLVGGREADRLEGDLRDPGNEENALRFRCLVVRLQPPEDMTVHLLFFSSRSTFDSRQDLFERITKSINFST